MAKKGEHLSTETKLKLSDSLKGRSVWNKGLKGVQKAWNKGLSKKLVDRTCIKCGIFFKEYLSDVKSGNGKYCSRSCWKDSVKPNSGSFGSRKYEKNQHWNWKGGITPTNISFRTSRDYLVWRAAVMLRDNYTCQDCGERGGKLNVHHIKPFSLYPELRLSIDNGQVLCYQCHKKTDSFSGKIMTLRKGGFTS